MTVRISEVDCVHRNTYFVQDVVRIEVIKNLLIDYSFKIFAYDIEDTVSSILRQE